ncbi:MAG: N-glycosylase/DNA lyase [Conexivisphaera sp.]
MSEPRVRAVSEAFSEVGLDRVLAVEESLDPQFAFAADVARRWGAGPGSLCSMLAALVTYRLAMRGEEWWECFRDFFSGHECPGDPEGAARAVGQFLSSCRGGVVARDTKLRRLGKALAAGRWLRLVAESPREAILGEYGGLLSAIASALGQRPDDKTVVFSLKMAYYACRGSACPGAVLPMDVQIPVDVRVSCVSHSSGIIDVPPGADPVRTIMSRPEAARRAWSEVSRASGIPPLHLDTVIWRIGWAPRDLPVRDARAAAAGSLEPVLGPSLSARLAGELIVRGCRVAP